MEEFQKPISGNKSEKKKSNESEEERLGWNGSLLRHYHGFWYLPEVIQGIQSFQTHFRAKDSDAIVASIPKSGTTWLKALTFSIINRHSYAAAESPLLSSNPHDLVPFLELLWVKAQNPNINSKPNSRIFSTHIPYQLLPQSILDSKCKIVYICRNPLDIFVSSWHFTVQNQLGPRKKQISIDDAFGLFCKGLVINQGPFWDHMLGYWHASSKNPEKILFLKYEDLKKDIISCVKRVADFLDFSFSLEEERDGAVEEIVRLCSLEKLKDLEVNKNGEWQAATAKVKNSSFFRKGEVGDWANFLSPSMVERLQKLMEEKLGVFGLSFE